MNTSSSEGNNGNGIRITNREVYDLVVELKDDVGDMARMVDQVVRENKDLKKRLVGLEVKVYALLAGLIAAVAGALMKGDIL